MPAPPLPTPNSQLLAWHGWHLALPPEWSPVKIDGDWHKGSILIADLHATRLAIRWQAVTRPRSFNAETAVRDAIRHEVGELMLQQATPLVPSSSAWSAGRLFIEPEPPGRDVWVGHSLVGNRMVELVHQTKHRSRLLAGELVPTLRESPLDRPQHWSIFDLRCTVPAGWSLQGQRLNAGDLTLTFARGRETLVVRQVGPASLALARQPLEAWITSHASIWRKLYRTSDPPGTLRRRRRFFYLRWISPERHVIVRHDAERDRLMLVDASSRLLASEVLASM